MSASHFVSTKYAFYSEDNFAIFAKNSDINHTKLKNGQHKYEEYSRRILCWVYYAP
jgi:hypothetical protein